MSPLIRYWSAISTPSSRKCRLGNGARQPAYAEPSMPRLCLPYARRAYLLLQLALARGVLAVFPDHPLAVLHDVFGDQRHGILPVVVERDRPNDGIVVRDLAECSGDLL